MKTIDALMRVAFALVIFAAVAGAADAAAQAAPAPGANESTLAADEARDLFGNWTMTLETPDGTFPLAFTIGEQDGKVAVSFTDIEGPAITNIAKSGDGFIARSQIDYQGMNLPIVITVTKDGENLKANWDFGDGAYVTSGTAVRAS